mgnify:CR=1 FL=1
MGAKITQADLKAALEAASRAEEVRMNRGRLRRVLNRQREPLDLWFSENHLGRRLAYIDEAATRQRLLPLVPLFAGLQDFEVEQLAEAFSTQDFEEGETIIRQGDDGDKFYLLEEGSAAVRVALHHLQRLQAAQTAENKGQWQLSFAW